MTVAVCITTYNRRKELERTLAKIQALAPMPDAVLVVADGCTDGTAAAVREQYPAVVILEHAVSRGSVASRNEMAQSCSCDLLVSFDDDSYPLEFDFVAKVRALFEQYPRLAVATFPQRSDEDPATLTLSDFGPSRYVGTFANSSAVIRREAFVELGGYPEFFFHAYEEPDFAIRCVAAGWELRYETSILVRHHFTSVQRNERRTHQRHARNELWSVVLRCPAPMLLAVILFRVVRQFGYAWHRGIKWALTEPLWWWAALRGLPRCLELRKPIPWRIYFNWMRVLRRPLSSSEEWARMFARKG